MNNFEGVTVDSVINELKQIDSYEDILKVGAEVKGMILAKKNSPFLPMDVYDQMEDRMKARDFLMAAIYN